MKIIRAILIFWAYQFGQFRKLLKETAVKDGVTFLAGTRITGLETRPYTQPAVILESGEKLKADVVIGADGMESLVRRTIVGQEERSTYLGNDVFNVIVPGDKIAADPALQDLLDEVCAPESNILVDRLTFRAETYEVCTRGQTSMPWVYDTASPWFAIYISRLCNEHFSLGRWFM